MKKNWKSVIEEAFVLSLCGAVEISERGVKYNDWFNETCYICFPTQSYTKAVVRYFKDNKLDYVMEFENGVLNGRIIKYWDNGKINYETNYKNGLAHGKHTGYYENGQIEWEDYWADDVLIKETTYEE